jgi:hypothetical protein
MTASISSPSPRCTWPSSTRPPEILPRYVSSSVRAMSRWMKFSIVSANTCNSCCTSLMSWSLKPPGLRVARLIELREPLLNTTSTIT